MKASTINKKWILTASLVTVLVSQYSYQTSSLTIAKTQIPKNSGEYVLASIDDQRLPAQQDTRPTRAPIKRNDVKPDSTSTETTKPAPTKTETESTVTEEGACTSGDCKTAATDISNISAEEFTKLITRLEALEKVQKEKPAPTTAATTPNKEDDKKASDSDCEPARADESRTEKRERLKCEKEEKEEALKEERIAKFEDRADALKDKCEEDLECLTSGFTSLLSRFEGKQALPASTVNKQFRFVMGTALTKALYSNDPEAVSATLTSLQSLMQDMPDQYRILKQSIIDVVKNQATLSANKVSANYAKANMLAKQNNPQAYFEALQTARTEHEVLTYLTNSYSSSIEQSLQTVGDSTTFAYYQKSYVPNMQKIMSAVMTGQTLTITGTETTTTPGTTQVNTSGTNQPSTTVTIPQPMTGDKMTRDNTWLIAPTNSNIQFGPVNTVPTVPNTRAPRGIQ